MDSYIEFCSHRQYGVTPGMLRPPGEMGVDALLRLLNQMYKTGYLPAEIPKSTLMTLPKTIELLNVQSIEKIV